MCFIPLRILNPQLRTLGSKDDEDVEAYDRFCNKQDRAFSVQGEKIFLINYLLSSYIQKFIILLSLLVSTLLA